ncbi:unnamed protein product [Closterium sp. NIES-64]|nr:unnamed protein product [Closterium sp. NIES-64]CAI5948206.1 unnamed protein product [Closterium sp. NIES-65]CAI5985349.1 unnamed protein product [Closterium sp. NIES-65]
MRHGEEQEQHRHSHLPLIVPKGSWKEVYRGLVELDREWKVPPQLPLQAVGSSSEEEGWGAEWTLRDDFFWFSQPFPRLQEARESLTFRLDLPLCLVTGVEIVSGQDIWNAVCPNFLQVEVGFSPSSFPFSSASFPLSPAPISHLLRLPPSALALGNHVRLLLSGSPWAEGWAEAGGEGGRKGGGGGYDGGWREGGAGRGSKGRRKGEEGEGKREERVRVFGIPLGALPPQNALQGALVRYAVGRDGGELDAVMRSAVGRGVQELGSVETVVKALGDNLVNAFPLRE